MHAQVIRLEGTPEEIGEALKFLPSAGTPHTTDVEMNGHDATDDVTDNATEPEETFVSTEFAKRALHRRPLSPQMKNVLKKLYEAHPGSLSTEELHDAAGYTPPQFAGLMGAFGRRLSHTNGYDADRHFFDWRWNDDRGVWDCQLPDTVRQALEEEGIV